MASSELHDQLLHNMQALEDSLDEDRDQLEYEEFCQSITEFAARFSWSVVLQAVAAALKATEEPQRRRI
jgi:hypothetical protein